MIPFSRSLSAPTRFQMEKFSFSFHLIWNPVKLCISRFYTVFIVASAQTLKTKSTQYVIFQAIYRSIIQNIAIKSLIYPKECKSTYIVCKNRITYLMIKASAYPAPDKPLCCHSQWAKQHNKKRRLLASSFRIRMFLKITL